MMTNDKKDHNCTNKVSGGQEVKDPTLRKGKINMFFYYSLDFQNL